MKRVLLLLGCLIGGVATGGGAAFAVGNLLPGSAPEAVEAPAGPLTFVPTGPILVPLVFEDGELAGYATIDVQLRVPEEAAEEVTARLPLLLHAINLRTYRTPLAAAPGGQLADLAGFRRLVARASEGALGRGTVRQVAITQARPA